MYIPYRGDKTETEVFSGFLKEAKMLDFAYNLGLLFLGEQKLSLEVSEIYKFHRLKKGVSVSVFVTVI